MHSVIADKKRELAEMCRRYDVARLEVFGSAARGTDFDLENSDADFLVEFDPSSSLPPFDRYFGLVEELRVVLGRPVDLVEARAIRNPYLRLAIDKSRELVYAV
ncbi:nucleotidyltransferase family protein [Candidatus Foliamicus sp.]